MSVQKTDINPETGKQFAVNPATGQWDDNYWASQVDPQVNGGGGGGNGMPQAPQIDVNSLYNTAYNSPQIQSAQSSITQSQQKIDMMNKSLADAESKINDNPYLSEAERVGRVAKLRDSSAQDIANEQKNLQLLSGNLSGYKTDAENKVNAAVQQYNIQDKQYQEGVSQFNNLLSAGALDYASPTDIANVARQTGMSTSMIQAAVKANQAKNQRTQVIPFNDGTNQGYAVINPDTGEIISKQVIAGAAPTKYNGGGSGGGTTKDKKLTTSDYANYLVQDAKSKNKYSLASLVQHYSPYLSIDKIYQLYNQNSTNGKAKETLAQVKAGKYIYSKK